MARERVSVFKQTFLISVNGHTWWAEHDLSAPHENLRIDVEEKVRNHGYIQAHESICLQLANRVREGTQLEGVDEEKTLGEVITSLGRKRLVGILRSSIPAASFIVIDNDDTTGSGPLIIHIDPKRVVHGLPAPNRYTRSAVTNNADSGVATSFVAETSNTQFQAAGLPASGQSETEAGLLPAEPEVPEHAEATTTLHHPGVIMDTEDVNVELVVANLQPTLANLLPEVANVEQAAGNVIHAAGNVELLGSGIQENPDKLTVAGQAPQVEEVEGYNSHYDYSTRLWSWSDDY